MSNIVRVPVQMLAFQQAAENGDVVVREVEIPADDMLGDVQDRLEAVFVWGQNERQNVDGTCSVSTGDVVELPDEGRWLITAIGFRELTDEQFARYVAMDRAARPFCDLVTSVCYAARAAQPPA